MKSQELRIGNLCYYHVEDNHDGDHDVINTIDYEDLRILFGNSDENYKPITLTELWLKQFGFVKEKLFYIKGVHQELFSGLMKFKYDKLLGKWRFDVGSYKDITRVEYVHQLQNLYFALTGNELTVKE